MIIQRKENTVYNNSTHDKQYPCLIPSLFTVTYDTK